MNFHFVDDFSNIPVKNPVKRFPQPSSSNTKTSLNQNIISQNIDQKPVKGIIDLLKSHDLTVMAALLEETELDKSIDTEGNI